MLPTSKDFSAFEGRGLLRVQYLNSTSAINVSAIAIIKGTSRKLYKEQESIARITLASIPRRWAANMKVTLASCTAANNNGIFVIKQIDFDNNYLFIANDYAVAQAGTAGTATLSGYTDIAMCEKGQAVFNGKKDIIGYEYSNTYGDGTVPLGYYFLESNKESQQTAIQVINTHATKGGLTLQAYWSLNGINWISFVPNKIITLMADESDIIVIDNQIKGMKIRLEITNLEGATFYAQCS